MIYYLLLSFIKFQTKCRHSLHDLTHIVGELLLDSICIIEILTIPYQRFKAVNQKQQLYQLFLDWAIASKVDGIVVGATFPEIIRYCNKKVGTKLDIFSPGIGTQGGSAKEVISVGADYLIVGRTILNAKNPVAVLKELQLQSFSK